jgi:hypothetical protein
MFHRRQHLQIRFPSGKPSDTSTPFEIDSHTYRFCMSEMGDLAAALEDVTEQLFSLDPKPS